jgi:hypothetical protein
MQLAVAILFSWNPPIDSRPEAVRGFTGDLVLLWVLAQNSRALCTG